MRESIIQVLQEDIDTANTLRIENGSWNTQSCPVALAFRRIYGTIFSCGFREFLDTETGRFLLAEYVDHEKIETAMLTWDVESTMEPFSFKLRD